MPIAQERNLRIAEAGTVLRLDYTGALAAHAGQSWFGVALGFRMLQCAASALSEQVLWDRDGLFILSGHPGDGVRDAVEYVTRCVSRGRYRVDSRDGSQGCNRNTRFAWEVGNDRAVVAIRLRDEHVPQDLLELLDRRGTRREHPEDRQDCARLKQELAEQIWDRSLERLFEREVLPAEGGRRA